MADLSVRPARTGADMDAFIKTAWAVQGDDPNWVPPLRKEVRDLLSPGHPFWARAERELFLAERGGRVVGRIAAIKDMAFIEHQHEQAGAWGFFECEHDPRTARALFDAAADWCRARGLAHMRGPLNPSTNYEIGMLVEGFDTPPTIMMTYNPIWYPELVEASGLVKEKDLYAFLFLHGHQPPEQVAKAVQRLRRNPAITVRHTTKATLNEDVRLMCRLFEESWKDNWGFTPMNPAEIDLMAKSLKPILVEKLAFILSYAGEPAAIALLLPDVNPLLKRLDGSIGLSGIFKYLLYRHEIRGTRVVLFGITPEYRKRGLPFVLLDYLLENVTRDPKYDYAEASWTLEDNDAINSLIEGFGGRRYKRYRIYRREL
ncbi:MAG: hypothetical protein P4L39_01530 [Humidesulfovibrio sp.]|nr:hypothetical protein [Humidesulfovibrio sp.]